MTRLIVLALMMLGMLVGCATIPTGGFEVSVSEGSGGVGQQRVDDTWLAERLVPESSVVTRGENGFATAQVHVRSLVNETMKILYQFVFFDGNGAVVQAGVRGWEPAVIHGGELKPLVATAPDKSVVRFVVRVRRMN